MAAQFFFNNPDAPTPNRPRSLGVTVFLLSPDNKHVFMEERSDSPLLGFFGGASEPQESVTQTAIREIREETGLSLSELTFVGFSSDPTRIAAYPDGNVVPLISAIFMGRLADGTAQLSDESRSFAWVAMDEVDRERVPATQLPLLDALLQWLDDGVVRAV